MTVGHLLQFASTADLSAHLPSCRRAFSAFYMQLTASAQHRRLEPPKHFKQTRDETLTQVVNLKDSSVIACAALAMTYGSLKN